MRRLPSPPRAWQAMLAVAGLFFTLVTAIARPVDLWRISVLSHRGQPLHAVVSMEFLSDERITEDCLSLGPETDASGSGTPFLGTARLTLNSAGTRVDIRSEQAIQSPTLALLLRVECPGEMLYARHFGLLIPPAPAAAPAARPVPGFKLKVAQGESVESLVRLLIPDNQRLREKMNREALAGNPHAFPDGRPVEVPPGTLLFFPDLRSLHDLPERPAATPTAKSKPPPSSARSPDTTAPDAKPPSPPRPEPAATKPQAPDSPAANDDAIAPLELPPAVEMAAAPSPAAALREPAAASKPSTLKPSSLKPSTLNPSTLNPAAPQVRPQATLELGTNPTPQQCSQALALCAGLAEGELEQRARSIEESAATLKLRQESIEQQLDRLERSVQSLRRAVAQPPAAAPAKTEIRTVVKSEPMPWYYWLGLLGAIMASAFGGFIFGRKRALSDAVVAEDTRLDRMLATVAASIREMETAPVPKPAAPQRSTPPARILPPLAETPEPEPVPRTPAPDSPAEVLEAQGGAAVDLERVSGPTENPAGLSTDLLFEMDQALDNTRSMFTDADRFIALGRTQNAISLLQFQVHKDPKGRDSWIKLMAIYRQEEMDVELAKAAREFKRNFPAENPPVG